MKRIYIIIMFILIVITILFINNGCENKTIISIDSVDKVGTIVENKPLIKNIVNDNKILNKYKTFEKIIYNNNLNLKLEKEIVPQGISLVDNYIFITGYYENGNKSVVIIFDLEGNLIKEVKLDTNSHVGSISYDKINNLIWIPGNNGNLLAYNKDDFFNDKSVKNKYKIDYVKNNLYDYINANKYNIAFLTIDDKYIYIGNFYQARKCLVKKYQINNNNNDIKLEYISEFKLPSRVQGISFYHRDNKTYLITSNSYNRFEKSKLKIYEYDESIEDYSHKSIKVYEMPPMSEQVSIYDDYGFLIFESGAKKYYNASDKLKNIIILDLNKIFDTI